MSAKIITLGIQKGGCSKSTTTAILSYLLTSDKYRTLAVDMDSQGNISELLLDKPCNEFIGNSVFEAIIERNPKPYIQTVNEYLDVLPSNNLFAAFSKYCWTGDNWDGTVRTAKPKDYAILLRETLEKVKDEYDYILIDTPPSLNEATTNAFVASTHVLVMYECSRWCYSAIPNFMMTLESAKEAYNPDLIPIGILRTLSDARRSDMKEFAEYIEQDYPELMFEDIIRRSAAAGRISMYGIDDDNSELKDALKHYRSFYNEFLKRVNSLVPASKELI